MSSMQQIKITLTRCGSTVAKARLVVKLRIDAAVQREVSSSKLILVQFLRCRICSVYQGG